MKNFERVHKGLTDDGILMIDAYGGHDSWRTIKEKTKHKGFTYFWDQAEYDPMSANMIWKAEQDGVLKPGMEIVEPRI